MRDAYAVRKKAHSTTTTTTMTLSLSFRELQLRYEKPIQNHRSNLFIVNNVAWTIIRKSGRVLLVGRLGRIFGAPI
ncbi:unnamed protein product [Heligmosomoides polygyrus]|uniref:Uncharacterized protein n=1 Tax=Heligmosomoides polygyrus TaxID=6339 RepID=A0A183FIZ8_HELPZ|nr:unnamed protein product [Heligmosomoides polygyrus]